MMKVSGAILFSFVSFAANAQPITCNLEDDTPTAQAAINATRQLILPAGTCRFSSINATNLSGVSIIGQGNLISQIVPIQSGVNVIDLTGSNTKTLRDFRICGYCDMSVIPSTGILDAQSSLAYSSDVTIIERVRVDGKFSLAAWYNLAVASSAISYSQFYNYNPGGQVAIITGNNFFGAVSHFTTIDNSNNHTPSDWTFTQVEFHNLSGSGGALWIGGATSLRFYGGNMSSSGIPVSINATLNGSGVAISPGWIIFDGVTFYNDFPPTPPRAITNNSGVAPLMRANQAGFPLF